MTFSPVTAFIQTGRTGGWFPCWEFKGPGFLHSERMTDVALGAAGPA